MAVTPQTEPMKPNPKWLLMDEGGFFPLEFECDTCTQVKKVCCGMHGHYCFCFDCCPDKADHIKTRAEQAKWEAEEVEFITLPVIEYTNLCDAVGELISLLDGSFNNYDQRYEALSKVKQALEDLK